MIEELKKKAVNNLISLCKILFKFVNKNSFNIKF